jgi:hypothetical protein
VLQGRRLYSSSRLIAATVIFTLSPLNFRNEPGRLLLASRPRLLPAVVDAGGVATE